jgi:hypothetical protein
MPTGGEDLPFQPHLTVLTSEAAKFLALRCRQAAVATAGMARWGHLRSGDHRGDGGRPDHYPAIPGRSRIE